MNIIKTIKKYKKENKIKRSTLGMLIDYFVFRLKYHIGIYDYLNNSLFDKKIDHSNYYNNLHTYIHKWRNCVKYYAKEKKRSWIFFHHIEYLFFKVLYPGLDAMDYLRYEFYSLPHKKRKAFITEGFLKKMNNHFNPKNSITNDYYNVLDNKIRFNSFFNDFIKRNWISSKEDYSHFFDFCNSNKTLFLKPASGGGGSGIEKVTINSESEIEEVFNRINNKDFILEEPIIQSDELNRLNRSSVNTIRVYTVIYNNDVVVIGATLRIGNGKGVTDNYSSGNYAANIDIEKGMVDSTAVSQFGERILHHPVSKVPIAGFKIPNWNLVIEAAKSAHLKIKQLRYIGWDVAIDKNNVPLLVEGNTFAGVELQQHPLLIGKKYIYKKYW